MDYDISYETKSIIFISFISFIIGSIISYCIYSKKKYKVKIYKNEYYLLIYKISKILFILSLGGYCIFLYDLSKKIGLLNALNNINSVNILFSLDGFSNINFAFYLIKLSLPNILLLLVNIFYGYRKMQCVIMILISFIVNINVRRNVLLYAIILSIFMGGMLLKSYSVPISYGNKKKKSNKKIIILASIGLSVFVVFFANTQVKMNKQFETNRNNSQIMSTVIPYFSGSIVAMDKLLPYTDNYDVRFGTGTFRMIYLFAEKIGILEFDDSYLDIPFIGIPFLYNTVPMQYYVKMDFGMLGYIFYYILFGYISCYLFIRANKQKNYYFMQQSSLNLLLIVMSIRENTLILIDFWIILISLILIEVFTRSKLKGRI